MGADTDAFVEFRNIDKTYDGKVLAVSGMNLSIRRGEFITLLGPSGSGKSTSLMMLAGFEQPTGGEILHDGRELTALPAHKRNFGMVFQNYALFPHMSILENIVFPLKMRKVSGDVAKRRAQEALEMVKLSGFSDRRPSQLSGGQQQRVALARALVFEPSIVLMDEPLGALDKKLREEMQIELKKLHEDLGVTFVFVTHDQDEALTMSDRIAVYNEGRIEQIADPLTLYEKPANAFVASFLGDTNMMTGTVVRVSEGLALVALDEGGQALAVNAEDLCAGEKAVVSVRPERIEVNSRAEVGDIAVRRLDTIYHGAHSSLLFHTRGGQVVTARLSARDMTAATSDVFGLRFASEHARAFRAC